MKHIKLLLSITLLAFVQVVFSQSSLEKMSAKLRLQPGGINTGLNAGIKMTVVTPTQAGILFLENNRLAEDQSLPWLENQLSLRKGTDVLKPENIDVNTGDVTIKKLHQYYKGIKV